jgi:hypothetical protein
VLGPRLNWPAFFASDKGGGDPNAGQTKRRSRSIGTLNTRPSSPLLPSPRVHDNAVRLRYAFRFGSGAQCASDMTMADPILSTVVPSADLT